MLLPTKERLSLGVTEAPIDPAKVVSVTWALCNVITKFARVPPGLYSVSVRDGATWPVEIIAKNLALQSSEALKTWTSFFRMSYEYCNTGNVSVPEGVLQPNPPIWVVIATCCPEQTAANVRKKKNIPIFMANESIIADTTRAICGIAT
jgi:hypothetical protein